MSSSSPLVQVEESKTMAAAGVEITPSLAARLISHHRATSLLRRIFVFHETMNPQEIIQLRSSSKLLRNVLRPPPLWTSFPNSNHATLQSLLDRLGELRGKEEESGSSKEESSSSSVPSLVLIDEGEYVGGNVLINYPVSIVGQGREKTTLSFGLWIKGKKREGDVVIVDSLKIKECQRSGLYAWNGMDVVMRRCTVEKCTGCGVFADNAHVSCDDLQVVGCGQSGVCAYNNSTVKLSGEDTSIRGNCTNGDSSDYGLEAWSDSKLQLVSPLTKEKISTSNGGGGNWGGGGTIEEVGENGVVLQVVYQGDGTDYYYGTDDSDDY